MVPAPAQGALAIQIREADLEIEALIESIKDVETAFSFFSCIICIP